MWVCSYIEVEYEIFVQSGGVWFVCGCLKSRFVKGYGCQAMSFSVGWWKCISQRIGPNLKPSGLAKEVFVV